MEVVVRCREITRSPPTTVGPAVGRPAVVATRPIVTLIVTGVDEAELRQAPQRYLRLHLRRALLHRTADDLLRAHLYLYT